MAQTTSSSSTRSKRTGSRAGRSTTRNGTSRSNASSRTRRTGSNGGGARTSRRRTSSAGRSRSSTSRSRPSASATRGRSSTNGPIAQAGEKVSNVASKAKTPLVAAGAALAGIAGGVALKSRNNQRNPVKRLRASSMPKALKNVDLSKIDLDSITSAANRIRAIGEQVGDVADAAEKTRKKHK